MHAVQVTLQFGDVLASLELLEKLAPRPLVALRQRLEDAMALQ
jgi:hypothetical protein